MQTSDKNIFAAGDIASYPSWLDGKPQRIEHWVVAQDTGSHAAYNMLGKFCPYGAVPYFWTNHYSKGMSYVGNAREYDEVFIDGVARDNKFIAYYIKDNKVLACAHQGRGGDMFNVFEAMHQNVMPSADKIKSGVETPATIGKKIGSGGAVCRKENCCHKKGLIA